MNREKYRYSHIGIPTTEIKPDSKYVEAHDLYISNYHKNTFGIEWLRFGENCTLPEILKTKSHIAFEVDDIFEAIKGYEVLIEPNRSPDGMMIAFVIEDGVPVEFLQLD